MQCGQLLKSNLHNMKQTLVYYLLCFHLNCLRLVFFLQHYCNSDKLRINGAGKADLPFKRVELRWLCICIWVGTWWKKSFEILSFPIKDWEEEILWRHRYTTAKARGSCEIVSKHLNFAGNSTVGTVRRWHFNYRLVCWNSKRNTTLASLALLANLPF